MKITLEGQECKTVADLDVGESGFVSVVASVSPECIARPEQRLHPVVLPPFGDCWRVTRTGDEELDVVFVSASVTLAHWDECLVHEASRPAFCNAVRHLQKAGWDVFTNYIAVMRKRKE